MLLRIFIIFYLCFNIVLSSDYEQVDEPLLSPDSFVQEIDQDGFDAYAKVASRSKTDMDCVQKIISSLREGMQKMQQDLTNLEQYVVNLESSSGSEQTTPQAAEATDNCETEAPTVSETPLNVTIEEIQTAPVQITSNSTQCNNSQDDSKIKSWDKQITVCKEILQNNKNLMAAIADIFPEKKRTIKIRTRKRKRLGKDQNFKRNNGIWTEWSTWSPCSVSCGAGKQIRYRKCLGQSCQADIEMDERQCFQPNCDSDLYQVLRLF